MFHGRTCSVGGFVNTAGLSLVAFGFTQNTKASGRAELSRWYVAILRVHRYRYIPTSVAVTLSARMRGRWWDVDADWQRDHSSSCLCHEYCVLACMRAFSECVPRRRSLPTVHTEHKPTLFVLFVDTVVVLCMPRRCLLYCMYLSHVHVHSSTVGVGIVQRICGGRDL